MDPTTAFLPKRGHRGQEYHPKHVVHTQLYISHTYHPGDRWPEVARNRDIGYFGSERLKTAIFVSFTKSKWTPESRFCPNEVTEATKSIPNMLYIHNSSYPTHIIPVTGGQKWPEMARTRYFCYFRDFHQVQTDTRITFLAKRGHRSHKEHPRHVVHTQLFISHTYHPGDRWPEVARNRDIGYFGSERLKTVTLTANSRI